MQWIFLLGSRLIVVEEKTLMILIIFGIEWKVVVKHSITKLIVRTKCFKWLENECQKRIILYLRYF